MAEESKHESKLIPEVATREANVIKYLVKEGESDLIIADWANRQGIDNIDELKETAKIDIASQAYEYYEKEHPEFAQMLGRRVDATANIVSHLNNNTQDDTKARQQAEDLIDGVIEQSRYTSPESDDIGKLAEAIQNLNKGGALDNGDVPILGDLITAVTTELEIRTVFGKMAKTPEVSLFDAEQKQIGYDYLKKLNLNKAVPPPNH